MEEALMMLGPMTFQIIGLAFIVCGVRFLWASVSAVIVNGGILTHHKITECQNTLEHLQRYRREWEMWH